MTLTVNSPFKSRPRISEERFVAVLREQGSLGSMPLWNGLGGRYANTEEAARALYRFIAERGHDPGVFLGIAGKEHQWGTDRNSVLWRNDTRSWTNTRTVRDPSLTGWSIITDPVRKSGYVKYANVFDSVRDGMYRVDDPSYAYRDARTIAEVIAIWAPGADGNRPREYAQTIVDWLHAWGATEAEEEPTMAAQIPGFAWQPADANHYTRGRAEKIRGGAQHYTAGTNSLAWLTTTSQPPVSATFLVRHSPTLEDRGWQLVRIEDTAWTTAFANPYTVSIEYEHDGKQPIPDSAYDVLARTWIDIAAYVRANGLGEIPLNRTGIRGHKEWVGNPGLTCPDGVDVDRIVRRIQELQTPPEPQAPATSGAPPALPESVPDPWRNDNPYNTGLWIPKPFLANIQTHGFMATGYAMTETFAEGDMLVQYFERARLELHQDYSVHRGLVGSELLRVIYPERSPT